MRDFFKRFGSLMLAGLFLLTTVAFTAIIYWQTKNQEKNDEIQRTIQETLQNQQTETLQEDGMLQGTKLVGFTPSTDPVTELKIVDIEVGDGEEVKAGATVTAHYTGAFVSDGIIFQSSHDAGQAIPFSLNGVIAGWTEGVPGMKVGGTRRLIIPAEKAYGAAPEGYVYDATDPSSRPLGPLVFDIELEAVEQ